jgi:hypothetical protein
MTLNECVEGPVLSRGIIVLNLLIESMLGRLIDHRARNRES